MRLALTALLLLGTAPALAAEIGCEGVFAEDTTLAAIEAEYGAENVVTGEVPGPEGTTMIATTIYPGDEAREMQVRWWDEQAVEHISGVSIGRADTGPGGIRIGMDIEQVQAINGEPFDLLGFGWDYGGSAGFESGALSNIPGGCYVGVRFHTKKEDMLEPQMTAISGDILLRSDMPEVVDAVPVAWEVNLGYALPDALADEWLNEPGGD